MSYLITYFDNTIPRFIAQLLTDDKTQLQYQGNVVHVNAGLSTCLGEGCPGTACCPVFENMCPQQNTQILALTSQPEQTGDQWQCGTDPGGGAPIYNYTFQATQDQYCATFDPVKTCTIGTFGVGQCFPWVNGQCSQAPNGTANGSWGLLPSTKGPSTFCNKFYDTSTGWVVCDYNNSFYNNNFSYDQEDQYLNLQKWLGDIFNKINIAPTSSYPNAVASKLRIRDINVIYGILFETYNQLYSTGFYSKPNVTSDFAAYDYFSFGFPSFFSNLVSNMLSVISLYSQTEISNVTASLLKLLIPPFPFQGSLTPPSSSLSNPSADSSSTPSPVYQISLQLSYTQYLAFKAAQNQDTYISNLISNLLHENEGKYYPNNSSQPITPGNPVFENSAIDFLSIVKVNNDPNYTVLTNISETDWQNGIATPQSEYADYLFATAQVTTTVKTWSPMLMIYFQAFQTNLSFSDSTCQSMMNGTPQQPATTIPDLCFYHDCITDLNIPDCKNIISSYCPGNYLQGDWLNLNIIEKYLLTRYNKNCKCYASTLVPPSISPTYGNITAMCFDNNCNNQPYPSIYDLGIKTCAGQCSTLGSWINNDNPSGQPPNQSNLDTSKFNSLCGEIKKPYTPNSINVQVLVIGIVLTLFLMLLTFSFSKHRNYSTTKTNTFLIIVFIVFILFTLFLSRDLAGFGECNAEGVSKFVCTSRITKRTIPNQFCNYLLNCECSFNEECGGNCICESSTCQPIIGKRKTKEVDVRDPNIALLISSVIIMIIFPIILIYLHDDYHWGINKKLFTIIVILSSLVPLGYILFSTLKKKKRIVFDGPCSSLACQTSSDCESGKECVNGNCICINGCIDPNNSDNNKECGLDPCGDNCGTCALPKECILNYCIDSNKPFYIVDYQGNVLTINVVNNNLYMTGKGNEPDIIGQIFVPIVSKSGNTFLLQNQNLGLYLSNSNGVLSVTNKEVLTDSTSSGLEWIAGDGNSICDPSYSYMLQSKNGTVSLIQYTTNRDNSTTWNLNKVKTGYIQSQMNNGYISLIDNPSCGYVILSDIHDDSSQPNGDNTWLSAQQMNFVYNASKNCYYIINLSWGNTNNVYYIIRDGNSISLKSSVEDYNPVGDLNAEWLINSDGSISDYSSSYFLNFVDQNCISGITSLPIMVSSEKEKWNITTS